MEFKDYYSTLGVSKGATAKEIKQAFRKLARKYHPDVNPGDKAAEAKFKELNEAHEVLGDPEKRRKYDELGSNWRMYEQAGGAGPQPGAAWNARGGGFGGGARAMTPEEMENFFGNDSPFSEFFNTFFSGGFSGAQSAGTGNRARARRGRDVEHEIELSLEDAFHGTTRRLGLQHDGHARTVDVRIPAGVTDGSRVRVSGEGEQGAGGAPGGDLFLRVRLTPHPVFERKGRDLHARVPVPVTTAILGGEAEVPTMSGKPARLRIPAFTQNGQVFRLKGYGMPSTGQPDGTGDLYARVEAELPTALSPEEREHYEALSKLRDKGSKRTSAA
jgi:DnaJ-class molecular chaperone